MASIQTLVKDIYSVFDGRELQPGIAEAFGKRVAETVGKRIGEGDRGRPTLRLSNLGSPCERKLWYGINTPELSEALSGQARLKFLFGDILEDLLLFLAEVTGHTVEGRQDPLDLHGVLGHRDAVIDGELVDVKSASTYSFKKFESHTLPENDSFGYLTQLGGYLAASQDDPLVKVKDKAHFLVIDKTLGKVCLDTYEFPPYDYYKVVAEKREMLSRNQPPKRTYSDKPEGKSGNRKLGMECSYCPFRRACWPGLRTYLYSTGPAFLTYVSKEPKVPEVRELEEIEQEAD
jgi:hypothetical protein